MIVFFYMFLTLLGLVGLAYLGASVVARYKRLKWEASWEECARAAEKPAGELVIPEGVQVSFEGDRIEPTMEELVQAYGELDTETLVSHIKASKIAGGIRLKKLKSEVQPAAPKSPHALQMPTPDEAAADLARRKRDEGQSLNTLEPELKAYMRMQVEALRPPGMTDEEFFQQAVREAREAQSKREEEEDKATGVWVDASKKYAPPPPNSHSQAMPPPDTLIDAHRPKENAFLGQTLMEDKLIEAATEALAAQPHVVKGPHSIPMPSQAEMGDYGRPTANSEFSMAQMKDKIGRLTVDCEADTTEMRPWPLAAETRFARQKTKKSVKTAKKGRKTRRK